MRSQPKAGSRVVGKLSNRSQVYVLGEEAGFYQVDLNEGNTGWVAREFLVPTDFGEEVLVYRPLQIGSRREDVTALKERMLALNYYRDSSGMSDAYNATCVQRVKLFQKVNDLEETGIATPLVQALLFSEQAKENTGEIPAPRRSLIAGPHGKLLDDQEFDWDKFARENPGKCMCCLGKGCECCNFTGRID